MKLEWRRTGQAASAMLLVVLLAGTQAVARAESEDKHVKVPQLDDPQFVEAGRHRFNGACTYCHGKEGAGGKTKSFKGRTDLEARAVFDVISNGRKRGANIMPPWKNSLSEAQIWELVAYILWLGNAPVGG